jgi:hypothetical protein
MTDFHHHPSPNQQSKRDGATPQYPFLTTTGVDPPNAKILFDEVSKPYNRLITLSRSLPPEGDLYYNVICGADVKCQTLMDLKEVVSVAREQGRKVEVVSYEMEIPVEGIRLEADEKHQAREIADGFAKVDTVRSSVTSVSLRS